jgi:predicted enzyme related to lactoylglutathione lyase
VTRPPPDPVVHLELHTANLARACRFYSSLCRWTVERVDAGARAYQAFGWEGAIGGGVVECGTSRALWLPYIEVADIEQATRRAEGLGASVLLTPREGPAGWRSVVVAEDAAEVALWQPKGAPRARQAAAVSGSRTGGASV